MYFNVCELILSLCICTGYTGNIGFRDMAWENALIAAS